MIKFLKKAVLGLSVVVVTSPAFAAVDVSGIKSEIGEAATAVGVVGGAVLLVMVGIKVFKWVRGAM